MKQPKIAAYKSQAVELEQGKAYTWCACGHSEKGDFCDSSHRGSGFAPLPFKPEESGTAYICMCKRTKTPPYCDSSHKQLKSD